MKPARAELPEATRAALSADIGFSLVFLRADEGLARDRLLAALASASGKGGVPELPRVDLDGVRHPLEHLEERCEGGAPLPGAALVGLEKYTRVDRMPTAFVAGFSGEQLSRWVAGPLVLVASGPVFSALRRSIPALDGWCSFEGPLRSSRRPAEEVASIAALVAEAASGAEPPGFSAMASLLLRQGRALARVFRCREALDSLGMALSLLEPLAPGDHAGAAEVMASLGEVSFVLERFSLALSWFERSERAFGSSCPPGEATARRWRAQALLELGRGEEGKSLLKGALGIAQCGGDLYGEAWCLHGLALAELSLREETLARPLLLQSRRLFQRIYDEQGEASCTRGLGLVLAQGPDPQEARAHLEQALALFAQAGDLRGEALCSLDLARLARLRSRPAEAAALAERARSLAERGEMEALAARCAAG